MAAGGECAAAGDAGDRVLLTPRRPTRLRSVCAHFAKASKKPATSRAKMSRSNTAGRRDNSDRLPELAADLVRRRVTVIAAIGDPCGIRGQGGNHDDPYRFHGPRRSGGAGLVASLARPGGNLTGINFLTRELAAKRLELLRELVPAATRAAIARQSGQRFATEAQLSDVQSAAQRHGAANPDSHVRAQAARLMRPSHLL